jgi:hypothetical protein
VTDLWAVLGALAVVLLPLVLAWWLLGRPPRRGIVHPEVRGNMSDQEER